MGAQDSEIWYFALFPRFWSAGDRLPLAMRRMLAAALVLCACAILQTASAWGTPHPGATCEARANFRDAGQPRSFAAIVSLSSLESALWRHTVTGDVGCGHATGHLELTATQQ